MEVICKLFAIWGIVLPAFVSLGGASAFSIPGLSNYDGRGSGASGVSGAAAGAASGTGGFLNYGQGGGGGQGVSGAEGLLGYGQGGAVASGTASGAAQGGAWNSNFPWNSNFGTAGWAPAGFPIYGQGGAVAGSAASAVAGGGGFPVYGQGGAVAGSAASAVASGGGGPWIPWNGGGPVRGVCGWNEEYRACGRCQPTCRNQNPVCTAQCRQGCYCKQGYIRERDGGRCILKSGCLAPPGGVCGCNEEYKKCGGCQPTCSNQNPVCTSHCRQGCYCKKGYIRDQDGGRCILKIGCPVHRPGGELGRGDKGISVEEMVKILFELRRDVLELALKGGGVLRIDDIVAGGGGGGGLGDIVAGGGGGGVLRIGDKVAGGGGVGGVLIDRKRDERKSNGKDDGKDNGKDDGKGDGKKDGKNDGKNDGKGGEKGSPVSGVGN